MQENRLIFRSTYLSNIQIQGRLILLAALFVILYSIALTISPAVLMRSWDVAFRWNHWLGSVIWLVLFGTAHHYVSKRLPNLDPYLLPVALSLAAWGNLTVWRLDAYFGLRQSLWAVVAVGVLILGLRLPGDLAPLRRYKYVWLTGGLLLTALTIFLGTNPSGYGPHMWLGCCGFYFQPSEPLKILLIIYLAAYMAGLPDIQATMDDRNDASPRRAALLPLIAPTILMISLATILLIVQRDLGTASVMLFLYAAILYVTTGSKRVLAIAGVGIVLAGVVGYALFDVVRLRVEAWVNPWLDPSGRSYQIVQSLIAIANGGTLGRGPGMGSPGLVPVAHSDFIFSAIGEEIGLIGALGLLILLALFAQHGIRTALRAADPFRRYLAAGLTTYLVAQATLIIGGNLRLLPLTGVTLPLVSYGGSSLVTSFVAVLFLLHISNRSEEEQPFLHGTSRPYLQLAAFLFIGLAGAALATGWWAIYRSPALLARTDNPRRAIADQYVKRGAILDRKNQVISSSSGTPGEYQRTILYPALSPIIGYTHPVYGQAGLEASADDYLRGLRGNSTLSRWWNHILYGQPPPGLDVRTTINLDSQKVIDGGLAGQVGAAVLLNASTGEILAMASHPGFDANRLDELWNELIQDPDSPLLNRATLGRYDVSSLSKVIFPEGLGAYGLDQPLQFILPTGDPPSPDDPQQALSPLQVALAAAAISSGGVRPAPNLVSAVNTPSAGWVLLPPAQEPIEAIPPTQANARALTLAPSQGDFWEYTASPQPGTVQPVTWYVSGTLPDTSETPLALAVILEQDNPKLAQDIGRQLLSAALP